MSATKKWLVKDQDGRIIGPISTEDVLVKIRRGEFVGEEMISLYPGGKWYALAAQKDFYDVLLEVLVDDKSRVSMHNFVEKTAPGTVDPDPTEVVQPHTSTPPPEAQAKVIHEKSEATKTKKTKSKELPIIDLIDVKKILKREKLRVAIGPAIAVLVVVIALKVFILSPEEDVDRIHLLAPNFGRVQMPAEKIRAKVKIGVAEYVRDVFASYKRAQDTFVEVLEADARNADVMAALCMTYLELWPYAFQDSQDLKAVAHVTQTVGAIDPAGVNGSTCRIVENIVRGRYIEAKATVDSILETTSQDANPPIAIYYLKARLLENTADLQAAIGYARSAQQLWPQWIRPYVLEAELQNKAGDFTSSASRYRQILNAIPKHKISTIELGLIEYKYFNQYDKARELLGSALNDPEGAPKHVLSRGYFGLAEIAIYQNDTSAALKYAQKSYALNPSNEASKNLIVRLGGVDRLRKTKVKDQQLVFEGDQFAREGDCNAAQAHYKSAYELNDKNAVAAMKAGQCLWKLSLSTEAIEWLNKAIKADPNLIEAYVGLADFYSQRYNFQAAGTILSKAKVVAPKNFEVYRGYALVELRRNNGKGAIQYGKLALQLYETDVDTHVLMARAYMITKEFREAFSHAAKSVELDMNNREAQVVYAQAMVGVQGVDAGADYLNQRVKRFPMITEYRVALGQILMSDERYTEAESVLRQAVQLDPKSKPAHVYLGRVLRYQNKLEEALQVLFKAAVLDPADAEALFDSGTIYLDAKKTKEARIQFERVVRVNPSYPLVHYQMGQAALIGGDAKEALTQAQEERKVNPNLAEAYLLAADAYTKLEQYSLCAQEYQKAIQLRPQGAIIYVRLARCYRLAGNLEVALSMLNTAASKESGNPEVYKEQGAIYEMKGELERAIEAYNQYFILDPSAPDKKIIRSRLELKLMNPRHSE